MFREEGHPDISLSDWNTFRREFSPYLFETVLDRSDVLVANRLVPLARGFAIASPAFLRKAGCLPGMRRRRGWRKMKTGILVRDIGLERHLLVRELQGQTLWTIEHNDYTSPFAEILVFLFGSTPVVARTPRDATYVADFCLQNVPTGFRWIKTSPSDYHGAKKHALRHRFSEIEAQLVAKAALRTIPPGRRAARRARLAAIEARKKPQR